jgi:hypothetical protein
MAANMTDQELASLYLRYHKRPAGCLPFAKNEVSYATCFVTVS